MVVAALTSVLMVGSAAAYSRVVRRLRSRRRVADGRKPRPRASRAARGKVTVRGWVGGGTRAVVPSCLTLSGWRVGANWEEKKGGKAAGLALCKKAWCVIYSSNSLATVTERRTEPHTDCHVERAGVRDYLVDRIVAASSLLSCRPRAVEFLQSAPIRALRHRSVETSLRPN